MTQEPKLRWGILGAARINERMLPAIMAAKNAELVAIASRRPGAALETLHKYAPDHSNNIHIYDHLEALLADPSVQAVYIPLTNREHAEWAIKAIEAGKHVLCEKPMALTVKDIEAIEAAAKKNNVTVMEGFMYRFHPQHARVKEIVASGILGEIRTVRTSFSFIMRPARLYRLADAVDQGGGAMWDIGCYAIHTARMWFDEPPISLVASASYVESGADMATSGILEYSQGRRAHFDFGFDCSRRSEYEITGTLGSIKCKTVWQLPGDSPEIEWRTDDGQRGEERLLPANHFLCEVEGFSQSVLLKKPPLLSLEDAKENCRIIVATMKSAASNQRQFIG